MSKIFDEVMERLATQAVEDKVPIVTLLKALKREITKEIRTTEQQDAQLNTYMGIVKDALEMAQDNLEQAQYCVDVMEEK